METKHNLVNVTEEQYVFGFMLETGMFGDRALAKDCALENQQVRPGARIDAGLECGHLL